MENTINCYQYIKDNKQAIIRGGFSGLLAGILIGIILFELPSIVYLFGLLF